MPRVAHALLGEPNPRLTRGDEWRYGTHGSLSVNVRDGVWKDFETGAGGGVLDLVMRQLRTDLRGAVTFVRRFASDGDGGGGARPARLRRATRPPMRATRRACARRIYQEAVPLRGTPAEAYLDSSRFPMPADDGAVLRFHPACPYGRGRLPCLIAPLRHVLTGAFCAIQRTPLAPDGRGRAHGSDGQPLARLNLGSHTAAAVFMRPPADGVLGVAEGVEDALAAMAMGFGPMWAACGTSGLRGLPLLPGVQQLTIFADHDEPGIDAAYALQQRWLDAGAAVVIRLPSTPGSDWADEWRSRHA